ncbi:OsmC family protein (macronuclear) [Tetrahymena thermophila SB210]|uniref:OsmC family protein n=1 Tax=Tetrahymena thermophila (strain SB210) TaxID=312017 RepID=Q247Q9_TETTS|nr:OsmC family protein [Tetrahymena thermophila SB210]EAS04041.1 OsmC family protein [Tetrahymena thermophila SB210]|eukprot:XP_001024286.1 OsmC family protein [Tetrahymena thermophila SB210]
MQENKLRQYQIQSETDNFSVKTKTESGFTVVTDMAKKVGGNGSGPSPIELLLSSLVGCENIVARNIASHLGFTINQAKFDIKAERDERGTNDLPMTEDSPITSGLQRIWGIVYVDTDGSDQQLQQMNEILKKRCPVARMIVDSGCKLEIEWKKLE